jgi:ABC-2 type transport system permease protein
MIHTIARLELYRLFLSPLAWTLLGVSQFTLALLFGELTEAFVARQSDFALQGRGVTDMVVSPFLFWVSIVSLLITPLLAMRLISEERRNDTLVLLTSAPLTPAQIVLGKYLGLLGLLLVVLGLAALMPLSLLLGSHIDLGQFAAALLGSVLAAAAFAAAALYFSSLTRQPAAAAAAAYGLLFLLWMFGLIGQGGNEGSPAFGYLALLGHHKALLKGVFDSADVVYYLLFTGSFLLLCIRRLAGEREHG